MSGWTKLGERTLRDGYRAILGRRYRLPSGEEREFEIKFEVDTAVTLAIADNDQVVLVREFRPGVEDTLLELPGGGVDAGEDPASAAARELLEDGLRGSTRPRRHAGRLCLLDAAAPRLRRARLRARRRADPEPGESPEVTLMPLDEFRAHLRGGRLTDVGPGYLALDALGPL